MRREWEEVGMCSKEAEALRVEETQGLGAQSWPCMVTHCLAPSSVCFKIAITAGGVGEGKQAPFWSLVCLRLCEFSYCIHWPLS